MNSTSRTILTPAEATVVTLICFGMSILLSIDAMFDDSPPPAFSTDGFYWLIGIEIVLASAALALLRARRYPIASLVPAPTLAGSGIGAALYLAATGVWILIVLLAAGSSEQPISEMLSGANVSMIAVVALAIVNGLFEETFLLGVLMRGLRGYGLSLAFGVPLLVRVLCHLYQGPLGAASVFGFGVIVALYYVRSGQLWPAVFAHIVGDIVPFLFIQ